MASIFTKIINGEIPCYKVAEDENYFAFLDINPMSKGHVLVIPKVEVDYIFDLEDDQYEGLMRFSKKIASAIEKVVSCKRVGILVFGLEVPHAHVHLIPINDASDMDISRPKLKLEQAEFESISLQIRDEMI